MGGDGVEIHILDSGGHCMGRNGMPFGNVIPQHFLLPSYVFEPQKFRTGSRRGWDMLGIRSGSQLLTPANELNAVSPVVETESTLGKQ